MVDKAVFDSIKTAGVLLLYKSKFAFMIGPNRSGDKLGIVRLGGHIEANEGIVECARREVLEEASVNIELVSSPITYYKHSWNDEKLEVIEGSMFDIKPIVVVGDNDKATCLYLAYTDEQIVPAAEAYAIVLFSEHEVHSICIGAPVLGDFIKNGGELLQNKQLDYNLPMSPGPHVRFLYDLINMNKSLVSSFINHSF